MVWPTVLLKMNKHLVLHRIHRFFSIVASITIASIHLFCSHPRADGQAELT